MLLLPGRVQGSEDDDERVEHEIVFQLAPAAELGSVLAAYGLTLVDQATGQRTYVAAAAPAADVDLLVAQMAADGRVLGVEPHRLAEAPEARIRTIALADQDATLEQVLGQQALHQIGASAAGWNGSGVVVAVLDTGVGPHPALDGVLLSGHDFLDEDADARDLANGLDDDADGQIDEAVGHGTHVAGIVHAVAPRARILPVRVLNSDGQGSVFAIARGIRYAVLERGATVVNLSLGLLHRSDTIKAAIDEVQYRAVIVASAGNDARDEPIQFPTTESEVVSVAAVDLADRKADFSNYNGKVALTAPGVSVLSLYTGPGAGFATWTGTSMAAPFVSGALALARQARPQLSPGDLAELVRDTARDISAVNPGFEDDLGAGRLDLGALAAVLGPAPPPAQVPAASWGGAAALALAASLLGRRGARRRRLRRRRAGRPAGAPERWS